MRHRGFTLIEAIIAVALLALAILCLYALMISSMRAQATSQETEVAAQAARRKLEELRGLPLASVLALGSRSTFPVLRDGHPLASPTGPEAGMVELCREADAAGDLPSVLDELGQDVDLNGDGDTTDVPDASFRSLMVKVSVTWWPGGNQRDAPRTLVLRSALLSRPGSP